MKSVSYPMFELSTIVDILVNARKAGKTINKQLLANIASRSKNASTKSGIFNQRLSSFKHYNLALVEKNSITFTPLADHITSKDKTALKKAFLAPETFKNLYMLLEKEIYLDLELLENVATLQIGISENGKKTFVNNFIKSGTYCGLIEYSLGSNRQILIKDFENKPLKNNTVSDNYKTTHPENQKAELTTSKGKAIIIVPEKLTEEDKIKLKAQIELF